LKNSNSNGTATGIRTQHRQAGSELPQYVVSAWKTTSDGKTKGVREARPVGGGELVHGSQFGCVRAGTAPGLAPWRSREHRVRRRESILGAGSAGFHDDQDAAVAGFPQGNARGGEAV